MVLPIPARRAMIAAILLALAIQASHAEASRDPACTPPMETARQLDHQLAALAKVAGASGDIDGALRYAAEGTRLGLKAPPDQAAIASLQLAAIVQSTNERRVLSGHGDKVNSVAFSHDGTRLVTTSDDKTARIWDLRTATEIRRLQLGKTVTAAAFSPDGTKVVTGSEGEALVVWDVASGKRLFTLPTDTFFKSVDFSPDGNRILANMGYERRTLSAADGKPISATPDDSGGPAWTFMSPDGRHKIDINVDSSDITLTATKSGTETTLKGHSGGMLAASFSPDGRRFFSMSEDGSPRVWATETGKLLAVLHGHAVAAAFSADGEDVATAGSDGTARVWSVAATRRIGDMRAYPASNQGDDTVSVVHSTRSADFAPDASRTVTVESDGSARLWEPGGRSIATLRDASPITLAAFTADGRQAVTVASNLVQRWDAATGASLGKAPLAVAGVIRDISPDARRVLATSADGTIGVYDLSSGVLVAARRLFTAEVRFAQFTGDGTRVVAANGNDEKANRTTIVWDPTRPDDGKTIAQDNVDAAALSRDGSRLAAVSISGSLRVWDVASATPVGTVETARFWSPKALAFSPDGRRLAAMEDTALRLWDVATGREIAKLDAVEGSAQTIVFSRDGTRLLAAFTDGMARVYDVHAATQSPSALLAETCRLRLHGISTLSRAEMQEIGFLDSTPRVDPCADRP